MVMSRSMSRCLPITSCCTRRASSSPDRPPSAGVDASPLQAHRVGIRRYGSEDYGSMKSMEWSHQCCRHDKDHAGHSHKPSGWVAGHGWCEPNLLNKVITLVD